MKIFEKNFKIRVSKLILIALCILLIVAIIIYFLINDPGTMWGAIFGSLIAGIIVAIIQYCIALQDYNQTEKLKELELIEILYNRDTRNRYEAYIKSACSNIDVMGVTASRFFSHFADLDANASEGAKVLVYALEQGVHVRILLPLEEYLPNEEKKNAARIVKGKYEELASRYSNIELKYFDHLPAHSIFRIDDTCIVGPVFPEVESKYTPALRLKNTSPVARKYIAYFDSEWENANKIDDAEN